MTFGLSRIKPVFYYFLGALFLWYEMAVQSSPSVMATNMMHDIALSSQWFGLAMGAYFFSYALMQIPVGLLFDRYRAKNLLMIAVLFCVSGTFLFSFGTNLWLLALARFFTGFGSAFAFIGVLVIANDWFDRRHFAFLVGLAQLIAAFGAMVGQMPLAYLVEHFKWQGAAQCIAISGLVLLLLFMFGLKHPQKKACCDVLAPWASLKQVLCHKQTWFIALYAFSAWSPIALFAELWGVPYLMVRSHLHNLQAASYSATIWIALAIASPILGLLSDRLQKRQSLMLLCCGIGFLGSSLMLYSHYQAPYFINFCMIAIGVAASGQILCFALIKAHFPKQNLAVAVGFINMAVVIGGALFQPLVGYFIHRHHVLMQLAQSMGYLESDYRFALAIIPLCYLLGFVLSGFCIKDRFLSALD